MSEKRDMIVCRCEEVTETEIRDAIRDGANNVDAVKRATRAGMGLCQSATCSDAVAKIIHEMTGKPMDGIFLSTVRQPIRPVCASVLATSARQPRDVSFEFLAPPTNVVFGSSTLGLIGRETACVGKVALLVTGKHSMKRHGFLDIALNSLRAAGVEVILYDEVAPNPTVEMVNRGAALALKNGCDVVVALGGGSPIDTGKAIAVVAGHSSETPQSIWDFIRPDGPTKEITSKTLPTVVATSTSGSGSHVTKDAVITNLATRQKQGFGAPFMFPSTAIIDPDVLCKMPPELTAASGFDALTHAVESFFSKHSNPISELYSLEAVRLIYRSLVCAYKNGDDCQARTEMALADTYAAWADTVTSDILAHAMAHPITGHYPEVAHGVSLAVVFPAVMRFNLEGADEWTIEKYARVARASAGGPLSDCVSEREEAMEGLKLLDALLETLNLRLRLRDLGVSKVDIPALAEDALLTMRWAAEANPRKATKEEIEVLYEQCY